MPEDPAITQAKQLWQQKRYPDAMRVLMQRVTELGSQESKPAARFGWAIPFVTGVVLTAVVMLIVMLAAGVFDGDGDKSQPSSQAALQELPSPTPSPAATSTLTPVPTVAPTETEPPSAALVPAGEPITYDQGSIRVLSVQWPFPFRVAESTSSRDFESPTRGTEFVGVEVEFTCSNSQVTCQVVPEADLFLLLQDGREVDRGHLYSLHEPLAESVAGGLSTSGWVVFEVPLNAGLQSIMAIPFDLDSSAAIYGALPQPVDGYAIEQPVITLDSGTRYRSMPATRRSLEDAGVEISYIDVVLYLNDDTTTTLMIPVVTSEVLFFEEAEVLSAAAVAMSVMAESWNTYSSKVDELYFALRNSYDNKTIGAVIVQASDFEAYNAGTMDAGTFARRLLISTE
jgi:hypothetical protein